jgi:uncharacterized cupin superfamily protein
VFTAADLPTTELAESRLGPPSAEPLDGAEIVVRGAVTFKSADAKVIVGVRECEPGSSRWDFGTCGELITVLSGRMAVVSGLAGSGAVL